MSDPVARSDYDRHHPWRCWLGGNHAGRCTTRQAAMNLVDRPYRKGPALVKHESTGETWERRQGSWFKTDPGQRRRGKSKDPDGAGGGCGSDVNAARSGGAPDPHRTEGPGGADRFRTDGARRSERSPVGGAEPGGSAPCNSRQLVLL